MSRNKALRGFRRLSPVIVPNPEGRAIARTGRRTNSEFVAIIDAMALSRCRVSYADADGVVHSVEVDADSLYEAVALAVAEFRQDEIVTDVPRPDDRVLRHRYAQADRTSNPFQKSTTVGSADDEGWSSWDRSSASHAIANWRRHASNAKSVGRGWREQESYNDFARRNGSGLCRDATRPRDSLAGSSRRCWRGSLPFALFPKTHRIGRPYALKIPAPKGRNTD